MYRSSNLLLATVMAVIAFAASSASLAQSSEGTSDTAGQPATGLSRVVVAFKTHFDIGYSNLARNVVEEYRTTMIDRALALIEQNRQQPPHEQFAWTIPGWPMAQMLWEGQTAARRQAIEQALKDGHLVVHALPFTTHTETLELEDLVRGLGFSSRLARQYGLQLPRDAKMTDVPCHTWVIPTLLKHSGVQFIHIGCNDASMPPRVPLLFWWEGPDGSRVLTMLTNTYGTWPMPPADWPHKTWLALLHTGDNAGPPQPDHVRSILKTYRQKLPDAKVTIGRMSDFADALLAEEPDLPIVRGDMPDTWIHGPMSAPIGCKTARSIRPTITAAETLNTHLRVWGVNAPEARRAIADAYENSLLYGEHTWGLATQHYVKLKYGEEWKKQMAEGLDENHRYLEESWDEHEAYIDAARQDVEPLLQQHLHSLARTVRVSGPRIVVFNPLPWRRSGLVTVSADAEDFRAVKPVDGDQIQSLAVDGDKVRFVARDVPPTGYRVYVPAEPAPTADGLSADRAAATIESPFFRAVIDADGGAVRSLVDKRSGRELIDATAPHGFGQYLYERHGHQDNQRYLQDYVPARFHRTHAILMCKENIPEAPYTAVHSTDMALRLEQDPLSVSAVLSHSATDDLPHDVTMRLRLYRDIPAADVELSITKPPDPWPESGWICLPLRIDTPTFRLGRLGSIVDPTKDVVEGTNFHLFWLNSGMTITEASGRGVGLCPIDSPLVSLGEPGMLRYSVRYQPKHARVYVNLFNNHWNTNFRSWWGGSWTSRVRLWSIDRYGPEADLITPSWEARSPLLSAATDGPAGSLSAVKAGLELSRKGILATAFGPNSDGAGLVLRLWEQVGVSGACTVRLPAGMDVDSVQPIDLRGRSEGDPMTVRNGQFSVDLRAYAPFSVLLGPLGSEVPSILSD